MFFNVILLGDIASLTRSFGMKLAWLGLANHTFRPGSNVELPRAKSSANEQEQQILLISIRFGTCKVRRLKRALVVNQLLTRKRLTNNILFLRLISLRLISWQLVYDSKDQQKCGMIFYFFHENLVCFLQFMVDGFQFVL